MSNKIDISSSGPVEKITTEIRELLTLSAETTEHILNCCDTIKAASQDSAVIDEQIMKIYEICAGQDVIRQRLEKIRRIAARIDNPDLPEDDALLEGPQSGDTSLSQDDTDRLMNHDG